MTKAVTPTKKVISVPVEGEQITVLTRYADDRDLPLGQATRELALRALETSEPRELNAEPVSLDEFTTEELIEVLTARLANLVSGPELDAMTARAEAAEARLASIRAAIGDPS